MGGGRGRERQLRDCRNKCVNLIEETVYVFTGICIYIYIYKGVHVNMYVCYNCLCIMKIILIAGGNKFLCTQWHANKKKLPHFYCSWNVNWERKSLQIK